MERIAAPDNLRQSFLQAARGKRSSAEVRAFAADLDGKLARMGQELLAGEFPVGAYRRFKVFEPKERIIHAASFPVRVMHHAVMNLCEPVLERAAIFDSYACRKGKGRLAAVHRARIFVDHHEWFLKMDIRKYFDSIPHETLFNLLECRFKDRQLLMLFRRIVGSYESSPRRGLPIGSLTSQHLANYYLSPLDRFIKETLRQPAYVRYMDDFVVWCRDVQVLRDCMKRIQDFLHERLKLTLKEHSQLNRTRHGMDFLGCRLFPGRTALNRRSRRRYARKMTALGRQLKNGEISERRFQEQATSLTAFVMNADSEGFRRSVLRRERTAANGLQPGEPRRQLEQQRQQLPVGQSQQQRPRQPQQQPGLPPGPSSTPALEGAGADPVAARSADHPGNRR